MRVNEHFEPIFNAVWCQLRGFKTASQVLVEEAAWSDVVREAQELVELALKAMLREVGIDPPKWHDVGPILLQQARLFPDETRSHLGLLARISKWLRKEREFSFYGDIDFIPTEQYTKEDSDRAVNDALFLLRQAKQLVLRRGGPNGGEFERPSGQGDEEL